MPEHLAGRENRRTMARRPGRFMLIVDLATGSLRDMVNAPEGRHFYGHAAFSADGRRLFTTENDFNAREPLVSGIPTITIGGSANGKATVLARTISA